MGWMKKTRPGRIVQDLGTSDLNQATDPSVAYAQAVNANATAERHYPVLEAGSAEVLPFSAANPDRIMQRYTTWQTLRVFHRARFNGVWSGWKEVGA